MDQISMAFVIFLSAFIAILITCMLCRRHPPEPALCPACLVLPADCLFPCGHAMCCPCARRAGVCPFCPISAQAP